MSVRHKARLLRDLTQTVDSLAGMLSSDDTPLSEAAVPAAIHLIEALQYGLPQPGQPGLVKLTEEEYAQQFPDNWRILMLDLDPNWQDPREQTPAQPKPRRRVRLL